MLSIILHGHMAPEGLVPVTGADEEQIFEVRKIFNFFFFTSHKKTNKYTYLRCVYRLLFVHQHVSIVVTIIIRVAYKNIRNPKKMLKCVSEPPSFYKKLLEPIIGRFHPVIGHEGP